MANTHSLDLESGSSQFVDRADTASLSITSDITIEFWAKFETLPTSGNIFGLCYKADSTIGNSWRSFLINTAGTYSIQLSPDDGATSENLSVNITTPSTGVWYHFALVWDASASELEVFQDTVSKGTDTGSITAIVDRANRFGFGQNRTGSNVQFFDGLVDELRVWNDKRTGAEISTNYLLELAGNEAGLVGYWKFNNDYTDSQTAGNNDLTANGGPVFSTDIPSVEDVSSGFFALL